MAKAHNYRSACFSEHGRACVVCGSDDDVVAHHVNGDRSDHSVENLRPVCTSCHANIHHGNITQWSEQLRKFSLYRHASDGPMEQITVRIPEDVLEQIEDEAEEDPYVDSRSEYIRKLIEGRHDPDAEAERLREEAADLEAECERLRDRVAELERDVERVQNEKRLILEDREEKQELVRYVRSERTEQQRWRQASLATRLRWRITGMPADDEVR